MKRTFRIFLAVLLSVMQLTVVLSLRQVWAEPQGWSKNYGGTDTSEEPYALVQASDGGYAIAGYTATNYNRDFWLVKTDADGTMLFNKSYGGTSFDTAHALVQTTDGGYALAGDTYIDGFHQSWLVKTDENGTMQWNKTYARNQCEALALVQTDDGGFALAGWASAGGYDFWLVKTDASGTEEWNKAYKRTQEDIANALVQTTDGGYAMVSRVTSGNLDVHLVKTRADGAIRDSSPDLVLIALIVTGIVAVFLITLVFLRKLQRKQTSVSK
jgi:predicted secreted protein